MSWGETIITDAGAAFCMLGLLMIHLMGGAPVVFLLHIKGFLIALTTNFTATGAFAAAYELNGSSVLNSAQFNGVTLTNALPIGDSVLLIGVNGSRPFMATINITNWRITNDAGRLPSSFQPYAAAFLGDELMLGGSSDGHASLLAINGSTIINETSRLPSNYLSSVIVLLAPLNGSLLVISTTQYPSMLVGILGRGGFRDLTGKLPINPDLVFPTVVAVNGDEAFIGGFNISKGENTGFYYFQLNQLEFRPVALMLINGTFHNLTPMLGMEYGALFDAEFINSTTLVVGGGYLLNSGWAPYIAILSRGKVITYQLPINGAVFAVTKGLLVGGGTNVFYNLTMLSGEPFIATAMPGASLISGTSGANNSEVNLEPLGEAIIVALIAGIGVGLLMMSTLEDEG